MVNRKNSGKDELSQTVDDDQDKVEGKDMFDALCFGADAIFGGKQNELPTNDEIKYIVDRTRHEKEESAAKTTTTTTTWAGNKMVAGQLNTSSFDAAEKMADTQNFKSVDFRELRAKMQHAKKAQKIVGLKNANGGLSEFRSGEGR